MKRHIFAICDPEEEYIHSLADYLSGRNNISFEVRAFTSVGTLLAFVAGNRIELLLINAKVWCKELEESEIGAVVLLLEEAVPRDKEKYPGVYKYQSCGQILRETMAAYCELRTRIADVFPALKKTTTIYGIYSPVNRCGKTSFALALGQELAKKKPVLFLCLEGCSGLEKLLERQFSHTFSDLLYYARQKDPTLIHRMNGMIQNINHLDMIPPVRLAEDIRQATWEDLEYLFGEILARSSYEALVLDIGCEVMEPLPILELCSRIYMPVLTDPVSDAKVGQFETMLRTLECEKLLTKTKKLLLPGRGRTTGAENYPEQLLWGEPGMTVREILSGEAAAAGTSA